MKKILFISLVVISISQGSGFAQVYLDPGAGTFISKGGMLSPRLNMGIHRLLLKNIGVYSTLEFGRVAGSTILKGTDERIIVGGLYRISPTISFFGGAGLISGGMFKDGFTLKGVRKELGLDINIPNTSLNLDLGFSGSGASFNIGYVIETNWSERFLNKNYNPQKPIHNRRF